MTDDATNTNDSTIPPEPSYFIDEGIPGVGARPEWLNPKFKTVADLAKSYGELEKKFGTVVDNYDISNSKFLDPEHAAIKDLLNTAKEKKVPKEVMDKMVSSLDTFMGDFDVDTESEIKSLGEKAPERLKILDNWAKANLTDDSYKALTGSLHTAQGIKALEELRGKMMSNETTVPGGNGGDGNSAATIADIQKEIGANLNKYKTDEKYRADVQNRLGIAAKNSGYIDKSAS